MEFAEMFINKLDEDDFQLLYKLYFSYKNEISEKADLDSIYAHFKYDEVEANGLMYSYTDVLPYGNQFYVTIKGEEHIMLDQYCLLPGCACTDAFLDVLIVNEEVKSGETICLAKFDYKRKRWSKGDNESYPVSITTLKRAIEDQIPNFDKQIQERHQKVKTIYAHCLKRQLPDQNGQSAAVGRNDPCPCGSGKKYKKCCLNKLINK